MNNDDTVNWTTVRARLIEVVGGRFSVDDRMTVADIESALQPFKGETSVADALQELEYHKELAAGLAQPRGRNDSLYKRTIYHALRFCAACQRWLWALRQRA